MADKQQQQQKKVEQDLAVVVDDNGRLQAQFAGGDAKGEATDFLRDAQKGGVRHLRGATVVTGQAAIKAMETGRI